MDSPCPIERSAKTFPTHPALITDEKTFTYQELDHQITKTLSQLKIAPQDRVAFIAKTTPSSIILFFSLLRMNAIACPLSPRTPKEQLPSYLAQLGATHFLEEPNTPSLSLGKKDKKTTPPLATMLFTSGSSNTPKIACHTLENHLKSSEGLLPFLSLTPSSRWLLAVPLFHTSGLAILFRCFSQAAAVVLSQNPQEKTITHLSLVPTQLYRLLQTDQDLSHLTYIMLGGAPLPSQLFTKAKERNLPIFPSYGMTEMSSTITIPHTHPSSNHNGKPLPFREVKIDAEGEIWVKGETLFAGYLDPATDTPQRATDWFATKDLGKWTPEGNLEIVGRKDRLFISGGENIQPEEIENALASIPGIAQATVLPIDDQEFGQRPIAFIHDETKRHTLESIKEALQAKLPSFKHPVHILPYPEEIGDETELIDIENCFKKIRNRHRAPPFPTYYHMNDPRPSHLDLPNRISKSIAKRHRRSTDLLHPHGDLHLIAHDKRSQIIRLSPHNRHQILRLEKSL